MVTAELKYSADGEGLQRSVDAADGRVYTYGMSSLESAPRYFPCFDQPDLKAPYRIKVTCRRGLGGAGQRRRHPGRAGRSGRSRRPSRCRRTSSRSSPGPYHQITERARRDPARPGLPAVAEGAPGARRRGPVPDHPAGVRRVPPDVRVPVPVRRVPAGVRAGLQPRRDGEPGLRDVRATTWSSASRRPRPNAARGPGSIVHEMAHMWFGDLVTMKWWNDMWLNESFAEYMAHRVSRTRPATAATGPTSPSSASGGACRPTRAARRTRSRRTA